MTKAITPSRTENKEYRTEGITVELWKKAKTDSKTFIWVQSFEEGRENVSATNGTKGTVHLEIRDGKTVFMFALDKEIVEAIRNPRTL